eukprot:3777622-Prymnesium_polylepis.1
MKLRHQLVRAALATLTVCRVPPDAMHNICSRTRSPTRDGAPKLVSGGVVVGPDGGRATLGKPRWSRS